MAAEPPPTAPAEAGSWQARDAAHARVIAQQAVSPGLPFAARITALAVEPGARVERGQVLLRFDAPLLRQHLAAWHQARRALQLARKRVQALRESGEQHVVTRQQILTGEEAAARADGEARLAWETLAADLDLLHETVDAKTLERQIGKAGLKAVARDLGVLRAPFSGMVTERFVALGEQVRAYQPVLELEALDRVYLDAGVPETQLAFWRTGETRLPSGGGTLTLEPVDGAPRYDAATGLWLLRYQTVNPEGLLRDGAWVEVVHLGAPRHVVWVPAAAVAARNGKHWCIVQRGSRLEAVEVQTGPEEDARIPVLSGLAAGERVVTEGAYELLYRDLKELIRFED